MKAELQPVLNDGLRMVVDLMVGCIFIAALLTIALIPADAGKKLKRGAWLVLDVAFSAFTNVVVACIHGWERAQDRFWRLRCRLTGKHLRPY